MRTRQNDLAGELLEKCLLPKIRKARGGGGGGGGGGLPYGRDGDARPKF